MYKDEPINQTIELLRLVYSSANYNVVLLTGREGSIGNRTQTEQWLINNKVPYDVLFMREEKDYRCDAIVKLELMKKVEEIYEVIGIFDDRKKVVDMWRKNGYYVFDVNQTGEIF